MDNTEISDEIMLHCEHWLWEVGLRTSHSAAIQASASRLFVEAAGPVLTSAQIVPRKPTYPPNALGMIVPKWNLYIRLGRISRGQLTIMAAACGALAGGASLSGAAAGALLAEAERFCGNVGKLTDVDQIAVIKALQDLLGDEMYTGWADSKSIAASFPDRSVDWVEAVMRELEKVGIVRSRGSEWAFER